MANFLITTPGQVTRGTTEADTIVFGGAGVSAATVIGNTGADTISINSTATFQSTDFMMNGGHDVLAIDFSTGGHTVASSNFFGGGKGNDVISLVSADGANVFVAKGGSGRDTITLDGINGSQISIGGNAGHDSITYSGDATKSYVGGGKGNDTIDLDGTFAGSIYGGLLNDRIAAESIGTATVFNGDSGNDVITVSGVAGTGSFVNGNAGNDTITVHGVASQNTVAGGNNADVIVVSALATGAMVAGGKGHDDITVTAGAIGSTIHGGLGADTIDFANATQSNLKIGAGDSTLGTMDVVSGGFAPVVNTVTAAAASAALVTIGSAGTTGGISTILEISNGVIATGSQALSGSLTAAVAAVDKLSELSKGGNTVGFNKGGDAYLFIQGGTVGSTADDIVVKFASTAVAQVRVSSGTNVLMSDVVAAPRA